MRITSVTSRDLRIPLQPGEGADAVHTDPVYSYAVTSLHTDSPDTNGIGLAFTLGAGTDLVCAAIDFLSEQLVGREIELLMADYGTFLRSLTGHHQLRWVGPHKGVPQLAAASITNACFDLWAKSRQLPLWKLLLQLSPQEVRSLLDLSYLDDALTADQALGLLSDGNIERETRENVLETGYPAYDTSVGWFHFEDEQIAANARRSVGEGYSAMKLKVGSPDPERDVRRTRLVRDAVGSDVKLMLDANQAWSPAQALDICSRLLDVAPYWIEEPTHPDDVIAHQVLAKAISPVPIAVGETLYNRVVFKNYMQAKAAGIIQVDCTRVGIAEFLTVSLLARRFGLPVVPHVGDMGQIHRHLVLYNHICLGHPALFLENIPHARHAFREPARVEDGFYLTPETPGAGTDLR